MNSFLNKINKLISNTRSGKTFWTISDTFTKKVYEHTRTSHITLIYETKISDTHVIVLTIGKKEIWNDMLERLVYCDFFEIFIFQGKDLLSYFSSDDFGNDLSMRELADVVRFSMLDDIDFD